MLFRGFSRQWTPVQLSKSLGGAPLGVVVAGERLALFRGRDGKVGALRDQCPHRGVALSLGRITDNSRLACPFHGWEFDRHGECKHVPLNPDAKCEVLGVPSIACEERGGLIWVFTGRPEEAPPLEDRDETLSSPQFTRTYLMQLWKCHWTRAMENMLDTPHLPFVHKATIGRALAKRAVPGATLTMIYESTETGGRIRNQLDGEDGPGFLDFHRPNHMALHIPIPGRTLRMHSFCVPAGENETQMIIVSARSFARASIWNPFLNRTNAKIALEDKAVVESSQPVEVPQPGEERSVATDKPTLQFRKYYWTELRESVAEPLAAPRQ
jgi:phenylpropionate dioxygenase-like ring-hydroxylating dioxygenase large terminal subunit